MFSCVWTLKIVFQNSLVLKVGSSVLLESSTSIRVWTLSYRCTRYLSGILHTTILKPKSLLSVRTELTRKTSGASSSSFFFVRPAQWQSSPWSASPRERSPDSARPAAWYWLLMTKDWIELFIRNEKILSSDSECWRIFSQFFNVICSSQWIWTFLHISVKFR